MAQLNWTRGRAPDHTPRSMISVWNVPVGHPVPVRFAGAPYCLDVHGQGRRSYPCVRPEHVCPFCEAHSDLIPCGYAPAQIWSLDANGKMRWQTVVCCLTDHALECLREKDLRGGVYTLKRATTAFNGRVTATFMQTNLIGLIDEFPVIPIVEQCWRNYLATFTRAAAAAALATLDKAEAILDEVIKSAADLMGAEIDQADEARRKMGGAL